MRRLAALSAAVALGVLAGSAQATIATTFVNRGNQVINSVTYSVWDMLTRVSGSGADWTNARLDVSLSAGSLFQHANGGNSAPNPALFGTHPTLVHDTYVTAPGGFSGGTRFAGTTTMTSTQIAVSWFDTVNTGTGIFQIARLTLTLNAAGTLRGLNFDDTYNEGANPSGLDAFNGTNGPQRFSIANGRVLGALPFLPGDTNGDGVVDLSDYNNVVNNLGGTGVGNTNADAVVDLADYNNVVNNLGASLPTTLAVPEPASLGVLGGLAGLLLLRRRDRL